MIRQGVLDAAAEMFDAAPRGVHRIPLSFQKKEGILWKKFLSWISAASTTS
jgi:hypothetical protein